jgi:hypothetical protein
MKERKALKTADPGVNPRGVTINRGFPKNSGFSETFFRLYEKTGFWTVFSETLFQINRLLKHAQ